MRLKDVLIFIVGFVGGIGLAVTKVLKWTTKHGDVLLDWKKAVIDDIEYLLLGYNTIKTRRYSDYGPYQPGNRKPRNYYTTSYNNYYKKSFREDEEEME